MIAADDNRIETKFLRLKQLIRAQGVEQWTEGKAESPSLASLVYLCKFAFFTALLTKSQIGDVLEADRHEVKMLVKGWYDDHRAKGCGTC